jgi:GNAT superfamily N-acetyltransferase
MNRRIRGKINSGEVGALYDNGRKNKTTAKCKWVYTRNACRKNECVPFGNCKIGSGKLKLFGLKNRDSKVRLMKIIEVKENKKQYLDLLLLADEQEDMVDRYLDSGKMYVLDDNGVKCECVITDEKNDILEIKNIATVPEYQGKGYARALIEFIVNNYREQYAILQVGTGDSPLTIPFYEKCGFVRSHIISNFFTDNYDHPICESGIQLVDMVYLQRPL